MKNHVLSESHTLQVSILLESLERKKHVLPRMLVDLWNCWNFLIG
jgi:hypothetical protein